MPEFSTLIAFALATIGLLLIPGPATLYIVNRTLADGRDVGLAAVGGLEVGDAIQATSAALGLSAVLATSATLFNVVKWAGVLYLVITGVRTLLTSPSAFRSEATHVTPGFAFRQGIVVNALNPKTALFFLSIFPQFVDPDATHATLHALVLAVIFVILATIYNGSLALMAGKVRDVLLRGKAVYVMRRYVSGGLFVALGLLAALAGRPTD